MGVKNLWLILSPVCERKSLWELENKAVAIDLSCWICDSQNVAENAVQPRMYLRNLFFRTSCLLLLGVKPIFVLEGQAPALKHDAMSQRVQQRFRNKKLSSSSEEETDKSKQNKARNHGVRSRFNSLLKQCRELLQLMGVPCVQSEGEAEALCAQLNEAGLVNGCITQDGDCFLYGAQTVFRNFTISPHGSTGYSVEVYEMNVIEEKLSLSRQKLIALSLLCGCDYNDKGVLGVGKETALKFLEKIEDSHVLERLKQWRTDPYYQNLENEFANLADTCSKCSHSGKLNKHNKSGCDVCELSKGCIQDEVKSHLVQKDPEEKKYITAELALRRKALRDENFPSQEMINEFLRRQPLPDLDINWRKPDITKFIRYSCNLLSWTEEYAVEKFLPLVTRWQLTHLKKCGTKTNLTSLPLTPTTIVKKRVQKGVPSFEVKWEDSQNILSNVENPEELLVTIEPQELLEAAYPNLVEEFIIAKEAKSKKGKTRNCKKVLQDKNPCKENAGIVMEHENLFMKPSSRGHGPQNILRTLNIEPDGSKGNAQKTESKKVLKQTKLTFSHFTKLCENIETINEGRNRNANEASTLKVVDNAHEHLPLSKTGNKGSYHAFCENNPSVDDIENALSNLSISESRNGGILEEFNNLDVDDEITNLSGIIEGIVSEKYASSPFHPYKY